MATGFSRGLSDPRCWNNPEASRTFHLTARQFWALASGSFNSCSRGRSRVPTWVGGFLNLPDGAWLGQGHLQVPFGARTAMRCLRRRRGPLSDELHAHCRVPANLVAAGTEPRQPGGRGTIALAFLKQPLGSEQQAGQQTAERWRPLPALLSVPGQPVLRTAGCLLVRSDVDGTHHAGRLAVGGGDEVCVWIPLRPSKGCLIPVIKGVGGAGCSSRDACGIKFWELLGGPGPRLPSGNMSSPLPPGDWRREQQGNSC